MTISKADIEKMLKQVRYDLSVTQTRVSEIAAAVASLPVVQTKATNACEKCGLVPNGKSMSEHLFDVHGIEEKAA